MEIVLSLKTIIDHASKKTTIPSDIKDSSMCV